MSLASQRRATPSRIQPISKMPMLSLPVRTHPRMSTQPRTKQPAYDSAQVDDYNLVFRRNGKYVAAIAKRIVGTSEDVEDIVQDVFFALLRAWNDLRDPAALRGWLSRTTVHICSKRLRRRRLAQRLGFVSVPDFSDVGDPNAHPADRILATRLYSSLEAMPTADRVAWTLRHLQGMAPNEVAQACGCSLATAKRRIARVNDIIHEQLGSQK